MKRICVISGSPRGKYSITLQTVLYLQKTYAECEFEIVHAGRSIRAYEMDMSGALTAMERADIILFCYPVYTFIAPYQLHRFIELIFDSGVSLRGKTAAQITTSKHFYDVTAHEYIRENCLDMGLRYIGGLSADMDDLLTEKGRGDAAAFWDYVLYCDAHGLYEERAALDTQKPRAYETALDDTPKKRGFDTVIVTNAEKDDEALFGMIADFRRAYPYDARVINIAEYPFSGGCMGCFGCASDGKCVYRDGFDAFLRDTIQTASAIVYAFTIKRHSMGASFKLYDDRQFCNGHRTVTMGKPVGYIINGEYEREANLKMIIRGRCEVGGNFLAGEATDAQSIEALSRKLGYALENGLALPQGFLGVGGMKIFRDLIYLMRGLMKADNRFYKRHGLYDFPQKKLFTILKMKLLGSLVTNPAIKSKMGNRMNEGMIAPYRKVIERRGQSKT